MVTPPSIAKNLTTWKSVPKNIVYTHDSITLKPDSLNSMAGSA